MEFGFVIPAFGTFAGPADIADDAAVSVQHLALRFSSGGPDASIPDFIEQLRWFARDVAPRFRT